MVELHCSRWLQNQMPRALGTPDRFRADSIVHHPSPLSAQEREGLEYYNAMAMGSDSRITTNISDRLEHDFAASRPLRKVSARRCGRLHSRHIRRYLPYPKTGFFQESHNV